MKVSSLLNPTKFALTSFDPCDLVLKGFNATLTIQADSSKRQVRSGVLPMKPIKTATRIHPISQECLQRLCDDPTTTLCIFSGSERNRLSQAFAHLPKLWIAAENGCFIRPPLEGKHCQLGAGGTGKWITMVETSNLDWIESVQLVFDYFCERTPRSYVETRETSLVWSYKYADPDFGRQQARDLLQHLWTGPISNAAVDVIQGAKSVEVRPIGVSKGAAVERIVSMMGECGSSSLVRREEGYEYSPPDSNETREFVSLAGQTNVGLRMAAFRTTDSLLTGKGEQDHQDTAISPGAIEHRQVDFVMCCGHFLGRDEDIFEYINCGSSALIRHRHIPVAQQPPNQKNKTPHLIESSTGSLWESDQQVNEAHSKKNGDASDAIESKGNDDNKPSILTTFRTPITCTVGRKRSGAGYYVNDSDDIAELLATLTNSLGDGKGRVELLQFDTESSLGSSRSLADLARQNSGANMALMSRQGSLVDIATYRVGREISVSNTSDNSSLDCSHRGGEASMSLTPPHSSS